MRFLLFTILLYLAACQNPELEQQQFLFLGHPYQWGDSARIDQRLEQLDLAAFDQIWLGGDVCSHTTAKESTLNYLDSIFDLGSANTHWTLGNHDVYHGNLDFITKRTNKNTFYTVYSEGICLLVLNTNLFHIYPGLPAQENCNEKQAQLDLIRQVCDTIAEARQLILLHHVSLLNELRSEEDGSIPEIFNLNPQTVRATCDSSSNFTELVYPWLCEVAQRGIPVTLVGGDLGMNAKAFEFTTQEGIKILGSGINNSLNPKNAPDYVKNFDPDQVLLFEYFPETGKLDWDFVLLSDLPTRPLR